MKKIGLLLLVCICLIAPLKAQKYRKVFFKIQTMENSEVKINIIDGVASPTGLKFKMIIYNKTKDYLLYNPNESLFIVDGKSINPVEKYLIIRPNENANVVLDLKGSGFIIPADYDFVLDGLAKVKLTDGILPGPTQSITTSEFIVGNFSLRTGKALKKTTPRTDAQYVATYTGDKIGIYEPNKVFMKLKDNQEYLNHHADQRPILFPKGFTEDFFITWKYIPLGSGDMLIDEMTVIWKEAFREVVPEKMKSYTIKMLFDKELSDLKGL